MSEHNEPSTYIEDTRVAEEVAYSAKDARSAAAALRRLNPIITEYSEGKDSRADAWPEASSKIMAAYAIYPEIFMKMYGANPTSSGSSYRDSDVHRAINEILISDSVPVHKLQVEGADGADMDIDERADIIEKITEALLVNPPSQDFLGDYGLGSQRYLGSKQKGYKRVVTRQDVLDVFNSYAYYSGELRMVSDDIIRWTEIIDERRSPEAINIQAKPTLLRVILNALDRLDIYTRSVESSSFQAELHEKLKLALNTESTTIMELINLYVDNALASLELIKTVQAKKLETYTAVVSGDAASYISPEKVE